MNKILRTLLLVIVALGLVLTIAACNNDKPGTTTTAPKGTTVAPGTGDNTTTAPKGTTTAPVTGDNTTTPNVTTVAPPTSTTPVTSTTPDSEYPMTVPSHSIDVDENGNLVYTKTEDWGSDYIIGNADETPYGTYTVTLTNSATAKNWVGYFFAGTDNGNGIWNKPAQAYVVAMREFDNALVLHRLNCLDWKAEDTKVLANVEGYKNGSTITIKSIYYLDGEVGKIEVYYLFGDSTEFVLAGTYTDNAPFTGTQYGIKMSQKTSVAKNYTYEALKAPTAEDLGYVVEHQQAANPVKFNYNGTITGGNGSIVLKKDPAATAAGVYTLKFTNMSNANGTGDNGLVLAHTRTGDATWEGTGTFYYFIFVSPQGVYLGKVYNNAEGKGAWAALKNEGANKIEGFTKDGDHELVVKYDGNGYFEITLDGTFLYSVTDDAPLTGTGYGFRAGLNGPVLKSLDYKGFTAEDFGYVVEHQQAANPVSFNMDGSINGGNGSIVLKKNPAPTAAGVYTLKYTNMSNANGTGDNGLVLAHTRTGDATWEGTGTFYYFIFVSPQGVYLGKVYNNAEGKGAWAALKNEGANKIEGFTKDGDHELVVVYDGNGYFEITLDGTFLYSVTDEAPLTGTGYGFRAGLNGPVCKSIEYSEYVAPWTTENGEFTVNNDDTLTSAADKSIVLKGKKAPTAAGKYTLTFNNIADGDNGMVIAHTRTGDATWEGNGTSYYFVFVNGDGVAIGKAYYNAEGKGAWKSVGAGGAKSGNVTLAGYTKAGEHTVTVDYNGEGIFVVYLDGAYVYTAYDADYLTGTGYGYRAGKSGVTFSSLTYEASENESTYDLSNNMLVETTAGGDTLYHPTGWWNSTVNQGEVTGYQIPQGTYEVTMSQARVADNCINFYFAGTGMTDNSIWSGTAYHVALLEGGNVLGLTKSNGGWNGWPVTGTFENPNREAVTIKVEYKITNGVGTIKAYAKVGDADYTLVFEYTDNAPLQGKAYGVELAMFGSVSTPVKFTANKSPFESSDSEDAA